MDEPERSPEKPGRPRDQGRGRAKAQAQRGERDGRGAGRARARQRAHRWSDHRARAGRPQSRKASERSGGSDACATRARVPSSKGCCKRFTAPPPVSSSPLRRRAVLAAGARRHVRRDGGVVAAGSSASSRSSPMCWRRRRCCCRSIAPRSAAGPVPIAPAGAHGDHRLHHHRRGGLLPAAQRPQPAAGLADVLRAHAALRDAAAVRDRLAGVRRQARASTGASA